MDKSNHNQTSLPAELQLTPEKLRVIAEQQAERRAQFESRGRRSPEEESRRFAHACVLASIQNYQVALRDRNPRRMKEHRASVADAFAETGDFESAIKWHPARGRKAEFREVLDAIHRDDSEVCECPDTPTDKEVLSPRFVERYVISGKHSKRMPLVKCSKCGHMNVRSPSQRMQRSLDKQNERKR